VNQAAPSPKGLISLPLKADVPYDHRLMPNRAPCVSCLRTLPDGARFCPYCGHEVIASATEERRVVTVVFADIVGYTALSEHLDPERLKRLIDGAFQRMIADIESFGGSLDKIIGDAVVALFGAPIAHEDDADRAIRTALQLHRTLDEFVLEQADIEGPIQLRVGVNTGEVVVGTVAGTTEYTAMGDVVNVASRLQNMAPPGGVYIGDSTASLASSDIVRELVADSEVAGREQTERVWHVTGLQVRVPSIRARTDVPFVGRNSQRELLSSVMSMVANGRSAVVAVTGEAGSGKTRLVNEMLAEFPSRSVVVFAGICAPYGETNVWAPIASALFRQMGIDPAVPADVLREHSRGKGVDLYGFDADDPVLDLFVDAVLHLLGHPSGFDSMAPARARETLFSLIVEGLRRRSRSGPIVLWLDDLQWADWLVVDLLGRVARSLVDRPVLVITAQRDDVDFEWPPTGDHPITISMPIEPLSRDEALELVTAIVGPRADEVLAGQLFERSGGNPLFLTELASMARSDPESTTLPGSLRALIASRLDRLPPTSRMIIDNASVLGTSGSVISLHMFAAEMDQQVDPDDLAALIDDGFLDLIDDEYGGVWRFRSDVVREVAYQTLTKFARAQRHAGTASVMANLSNTPIDQVAHHAATAAELVAEIGPVPGVSPNIDVHAVRLLLAAARRALDTGAINQAQRHATRALELEPDDPTLYRELLLVRAEAATERRDAARARADAEAALDDALEAKDVGAEARARRLLGMLAQRDGNLDVARLELGTSVDLFRSLGDDIGLAASLRERGFVEVFGGSLSEAEWLLGEAEGLSERLDDRRGLAWVRQHQAWVAFLSGDLAMAEMRLEHAAAAFEELGDRSGAGWAYGLLSYVRFFQRRFAEAEELALQIRAVAIELGDLWAPAMMDSLLASIRLWSGQFAEAEQLSRHALAEFRLLGDRFGMVQALAPRVRALIALGRTHEAERAIEEALSLGETYGDFSYPAMIAAGGAVHLGLGERAVTIGEMALERMTSMGADGSEARVTLALGLCQVSRADDALGVLLDAREDMPYRMAVHAIAAAMCGDFVSPLADAEAVWLDPGSTYLDRLYVDMAAAACERHRGDDLAALRRLTRTMATVNDARDSVARSLAALVSHALVDAPISNAVERVGPGWLRVIEGLSADLASMSTDIDAAEFDLIGAEEEE
jgi:class 3 adenylate cyclase/tetratricopeptide (TPR) repeat protein